MPTTQSPVPPFDTDFAAFAESLELALAALHDHALTRITGDSAALLTICGSHHRSHASALAPLAGGKATGKPNGTLLFIAMPALDAAGDDTAVLAQLANLETQMAETYAFGLTLLSAPAIVEQIVTTLPVESAHSAALGATLGSTIDTLFVTGAFENATVGDGSDVRRGFDPAAFWVG